MAEENKQQTQEPRQRVVAKGKIKKKPLWKRVKETFFMEDLKNVGSYIWGEVIRPAIMKLIDDAASNAIHMAVWGDKYPKGQYGNNRTHVSNASSYANNAARRRPYICYKRCHHAGAFRLRTDFRTDAEPDRSGRTDVRYSLYGQPVGMDQPEWRRHFAARTFRMDHQPSPRQAFIGPIRKGIL